MLQLLALYGNKKTVITTISEEFNCSKKAVQRDLKNILQWYPKYNTSDALYPMAQTRLEILARQIWDLIAQDSDENPAIKIDAIIASLKITQEQTKLGEILRDLLRKSVDISQTRMAAMPFEAIPEIKEAYRKAAEAQKAEKERAEKEKNKKEKKDDEAKGTVGEG